MITSFLLGAVFVIIFTIYLVCKQKFQYWEKRKVPYLPPVPLLGNFGNYILQKQYIGYTLKEICEKFPNAPFVGAYYGTEPALIVKDPETIKLVVTKDFYFFSGRTESDFVDRERFTQNLFNSAGNKWKVLRQNLTPVFTSAKMKNMFHLIEKCSHVFEDFLDKQVKTSNEVEIRGITAKYTMDCVGTCAFGIETNTMTKTENNPFTAIGNSLASFSWFEAFKFVLRGIYPSLFYVLGFRVLREEFNTFFSDLMTGVFKGRQYTPTTRNDFVDFIIKWKTNKILTGDSLSNLKSNTQKKVSLEVDDDLLVAQCFIFFAAGFETSATTLGYTFYELAKHPEAQKRAIAEVDDYLRRHNNELKYECLSEMPFVEACLDETLRMYPVLSIINREVVEDYTFPSGLKVEKGLRVFLPLYHLHHNPEFFPDPEEYRPERFLPENKHNIIPYSYMPFGEGPRLCIEPGMSTKIEFEPNSFVTQVVGGIKLKMIEREGWEERVLKNL